MSHQEIVEEQPMVTFPTKTIEHGESAQKTKVKKKPFKLKIFKLIVKFLNLILFTAGVTSVCVALFFLTTSRYNYEFGGWASILGFSSVFFVFGPIQILLSITGISSIQRKSIVFAILYMMALLIMFVILFLLAFLVNVAISIGWVQSIIRSDMFYSIKNYDERSEARWHTKRINWLQNEYECCGIDSYRDWAENLIRPNYSHIVSENEIKSANNSAYKWLSNKNYTAVFDVPDSCCFKGDGKNKRLVNCGKRYLKEFVNKNGCYSKFVESFIIHLFVFSVLAQIFCFFIMLAIIFTIGLVLNRKNKHVILGYRL